MNAELIANIIVLLVVLGLVAGTLSQSIRVVREY